MTVDNKSIKSTKLIYPQIYAYILPSVPDKKGWVKIGYTTRKNVDDRIKEQLLTAGIGYHKLWYAPAKFSQGVEWFKDKQFHAYLRKHKKVRQDGRSEWFYYNSTQEKSHADFYDFVSSSFSQIKNETIYQLRTEQKEAVDLTLKAISKEQDGEFLWNAKPRFGKTLATYDLVRELDASKVLIITNRPSVANSWFDDFEKFIAWQTDFAFVSTSDSLKDRPAITRDEFLSQQAAGKKRMLAFISLQDLKGAISFGGEHNKLAWVKNMDWDLLVIDEAHEAIDTLKTDIAFDNINRGFTLHLSGTPFKAIASGKFSESEIYNWTYADEQKAKAEWSDVNEENPYEALPRLSLFSYQMSQMIRDEVNKGALIEGKNIDYAFDLNEFFETNENGKFTHEVDVVKWLDALSCNEKYPFSTKVLRDELKHTFWLLDRVASVKALQGLLQKHPVFKNYKVVLAAGDSVATDSNDTFIQKSYDRTKEAIKKYDKTITLSVGQLTTGITIPEWTAVLMLSNLKSPSLYMQAAFRAQNPWEYTVNDEVRRKENAYVFDFAPERTLSIYDDFANNLSRQTANNGGTSQDRKDNIRDLLNFFPVIAEDSAGIMVELDVEQILTIPKTIKAKEVVRRGFISNLLFQNISRIFGSSDAMDILNKLNPVDNGKSVARQTETMIDTQEVEVDEDGGVVVDDDIVISIADARFGDKVYGSLQATVNQINEGSSGELSKAIIESYTKDIGSQMADAAKDQGLTVKFSEQIVKQAGQQLAREVEIVQKQADIKRKEVEVEYTKVTAEAYKDETTLADITLAYEIKQKQLKETFEVDLRNTVETKTKQLEAEATKLILEQVQVKKKNTVEDDVRARLRGFARTIPSFLMAYGEDATTLETFDVHINDKVFTEVTGITLDEFIELRDKYNFFDQVVFDESVKEFLQKRFELANYFDESQTEDIFDYIPPQQTNQIFTPKSVVKLMLDILEKENPDIFKQSDKTFVDLYIKSGLYLTEIVKRLFIGLEQEIPDSDERLKHILENQVYGFAPSEIIHLIARNFIFGFDQGVNTINKSHVVHLDTTPYAKGQLDFKAKCNEIFRLGGDI